MIRFNAVVAMLSCLLICSLAQATPRAGGPVAWILARDQHTLEGTLSGGPLNVTVNGEVRTVKLTDILSVNFAGAPSAAESKAIAYGLTVIGGKLHDASEAAVEMLTQIGLPVMDPLLAAYKDTDAHEPSHLYRLFARIVPGYADGIDRKLDLVRLASGETIRGVVSPASVRVNMGGKTVQVSTGEIRRLAIRRPRIDRTFDVQALRHCTQIEFLDTGVRLSSASALKESATGFVRLAFDIDGWASDPDGIKVPGPNYKTNMVDGFPFGALVGRVNVGTRWLAGRECSKTGLGEGRLYFAVNDNPHWQNNLGSFRVKLQVTNAYDLGDPQ